MESPKGEVLHFEDIGVICHPSGQGSGGAETCRSEACRSETEESLITLDSFVHPLFISIFVD